MIVCMKIHVGTPNEKEVVLVGEGKIRDFICRGWFVTTIGFPNTNYLPIRVASKTGLKINDINAIIQELGIKEINEMKIQRESL